VDGFSVAEHFNMADACPVDRAKIAADLDHARLEFHRLLAEAERSNAWAKPTRETRWTNEHATVPFHSINYYGSCAAALVYNRRRMGAKLDRVIASLQRRLTRENADAFQRGMHFPPRWDPFFAAYMTLADVYRYPNQHFDFHARQLALS